MPGVLLDIQDGSVFANYTMFSSTPKLTVGLQLSYNGMETTNPLRGHSVMYNIGHQVFHSKKNLPKEYNSCFATVHLLALSNSNDLKLYGFDSVLRKSVN